MKSGPRIFRDTMHTRLVSPRRFPTRIERRLLSRVTLIWHDPLESVPAGARLRQRQLFDSKQVLAEARPSYTSPAAVDALSSRFDGVETRRPRLRIVAVLALAQAARLSAHSSGKRDYPSPACPMNRGRIVHREDCNNRLVERAAGISKYVRRVVLRVFKYRRAGVLFQG